MFVEDIVIYISTHAVAGQQPWNIKGGPRYDLNGEFQF